METKRKLEKATAHPDLAVRWLISKGVQWLTYPMRRIKDPEVIIYDDGNRLIPHVTHDRNEFVRHRNRYRFFRNVIAKDCRSSFLSREGQSRVTVLDLGCGVGYGCEIMSSLPNSLILGVDISPESIQYASSHYSEPNIRYRVAEIFKFVDGMQEYDYIVCCHVLEHILDGFSILPKLKFRRKALIATPYGEPPGSNRHHCISNITEDRYAFFGNKSFYYDDTHGRVYTRKIADSVSLICVATNEASSRTTVATP